jgi:hypothetical protein
VGNLFDRGFANQRPPSLVLLRNYDASNAEPNYYAYIGRAEFLVNALSKHFAALRELHG